MNVRDDDYICCEDYVDVDGDFELNFDAPIIQVIRDAQTCHLDYDTMAFLDHCRVGLVPYYLTCHCKLAAEDSSTLVEEVI